MKAGKCYCGERLIRKDPDIMVVFGTLKSDRSAYRQWKDDNQAETLGPKVSRKAAIARN
ncbi:MAG TPA: hypothetical protein VK211_10920 [Kamptonema sp.]|nr:hypothetical protein [Kamptonema sp.]